MQVTKQKIYDRLFILRDSADARERIKARQELLEVNEDILAQYFGDIIKDETDIELLAYTAEILAESSIPQKAKLILHLTHSENVTLRRHACGLLGNCKDKTVIPSLEQVLREDNSADVRVAAAHALGKIGEESSLKILQWAKDNDFAVDNEGISISEEASIAIKEINAK